MFSFRCSFLLIIFVLVSPTYSTKCIVSVHNILRSIIHQPKMNRDKLPAFFQTTKDLILANRYGYEEYKVVTEDGYRLTTHRIITNTAGGPPIFIRHAFVTASDSWLLGSRKTNLVFQLADAGFDIWLSDRRGNWYSREHVKYKPTSYDFWDFSFEESGFYDLPATIDHILNVTKYSKLFYMGHSMGTTEFFVMASMRPEYNAKVELAVLLSPVAKTRNFSEMISPLLKMYLLVSDTTYERLAEPYEVGARSELPMITYMNCCSVPTLQYYCMNSYGLVFGENRHNVNQSNIGLYVTHMLGGASLKSMLHLLQIFKIGFARFNYVAKNNLVRYNDTTPPAYPLHKITAPVALYWSLNDPVINERGINELLKEMPSIIESHKVEDPSFNHVDFILGLNANKLLYQRVIRLIQNVSANANYKNP